MNDIDVISKTERWFLEKFHLSYFL